MTDRAMIQEKRVSVAREAMRNRVRWLEDQPDGVLHEQESGLQRILVVKEGREIRLHFANPSPDADDSGLSGRMSELDLDDPLLPFVPYTQGMMLTLLWRDRPRRIYTIGLGAGRVPAILQAHVPYLLIESTEIDASILPLAQKFFGFMPDARQKVVIQDGRDHLAGLPSDAKYDFIHVDAFEESGQTPSSLATLEFYALCKRHLVEGGVVCTNLVSSDSVFRARVNTMAAAFRETYLFAHEDATVLFGSDAPRLDRNTIRSRARAIQSRYLFAFPLDELAEDLRPVDECQKCLEQFAPSDAVLTDDNPLPE